MDTHNSLFTKQMKQMKQRRKNQKKIKFSFFFKVFVLVILTAFIIIIWHFEKLYHLFPSHYRVFFEQVNDAIFGKVQVIEISGNKLVSTDEVLSHIYNTDVSFDDVTLVNSESKITQSLMQNPVIDFVGIKRSLPNKMFVHIKEKPLIMRFWEAETNTFYSITKSGDIVKFNDSRLKIPIILGDFNIQDALKLHAMIESEGLLEQVTQFISFFGYRFDIVLKNKILVNLPENETKEAITILKNLITQNQILDKNIKQVDLRVKGKIFFSRFKTGEVEQYSPSSSYLVLTW
jgi:cell division septal protein FtsQ